MSKKGRLDVVEENGEIKTVKLLPNEIAKPNSLMRTVYENGKVLVEDTFMEIIERAKL